MHTKINPHTHFPIPKICMRSRRRIAHKTQTFIERTHGSADTICWVGSIVLPFLNVLDKIYCTNIGIANRDVHTNDICGRCVCVCDNSIRLSKAAYSETRHRWEDAHSTTQTETSRTFSMHNAPDVRNERRRLNNVIRCNWISIRAWMVYVADSLAYSFVQFANHTNANSDKYTHNHDTNVYMDRLG